MEKMKILKTFFLMVIAFAGYHKSYCQQEITDYNDEINKYTLSSPDVYTFEKYNLNPANHHVGKLDISIPIFTISAGNINYPLNLAYNFGGIKVDQLASDVGLGWSLSSALITRTVYQDNDFDDTGSSGLQPDFATVFPAGYSDHAASTQNGWSGKVGYMLQNQIHQVIDNFHKSVDFLPDVYNFYSSGYSTRFFFDTYHTIKEVNPKGTRISYVKQRIGKLTNRGHFNVFTYMWEPYVDLYTQDLVSIIITTNDGITYTFSDCDYSMNQRLLEDSTPYISPPQVSAWHITQIEDTKTGKKVNFEYDITSSNPNHPNSNSAFDYGRAQRTYEYIDNPELNVNGSCYYYVPNIAGGNYKLNVTARIDVEKKRLRKITYDEGEVVFNYNDQGAGNATGNARDDIYNGDYVSQIYVKNKNGTIVKSFNFGYSYFVSPHPGTEFNPDAGFISPTRYTRLKLTDFREVGKPSYKFSYDESISLPPVNSFSTDFLGYYNNSADITTPLHIRQVKPRPTMYYYPNKFEKSLLPFPVSGMNYLTIPGIFNRQADGNYAKAWSLNKVEYPTGGSSEYTYESNKFEIFGQTIEGGGVRIAQQLLKDGNGNDQTINYTYADPTTGISSGSLYSIPNMGHPTTKLFDVTYDEFSVPPAIISAGAGYSQDTEDWRIYEKSNLNADIASGAYVGYSFVTELEQGRGKKEFQFTSNNLAGFGNEIRIMRSRYINQLVFDGVSGGYYECLYDFLVTNSPFGSNIFTDNSYKRGKLVEEKIFNEANLLVKKTSINYSDNLIHNYQYLQGLTQPKHTANDDYTTAPFVTAIKGYKIAQYMPISKTISTYDDTGANEIIEKTNYTFNANGFIKSQESDLSNGKKERSEFYYPNDITAVNDLPGEPTNANEKSMYIYMASHWNLISEKIQANYFTDNILKAYNRKTFRIYDPSTNVVSPESIKTAKGTGPLETNITFKRYDDVKNVIQYSMENGSPITLIWGYNKTKLLAKIDNILLVDILPATIIDLQALSDSDFDHCTASNCQEQLLRNALNALRASLSLSKPDAMMVSYTYDPLVGITSITDPKGDVQYYYYDDLQRLSAVKDKDGNIISENQYHFKY
jgi:YD repeat-containing protein